MILQNRKLLSHGFPILEIIVNGVRFHSTRSDCTPDLGKLRLSILDRLEERGKDYPIHGMIDVAQDVLQSRENLYTGISTLIQCIPVLTCKHCPEVFIGAEGHLIKTCHGYKRHYPKSTHTWIKGGINDVLVPVETFRLQKMFQSVIKHNERFDYNRISAVVELCLQAGADIYDPNLHTPDNFMNNAPNPDTLSTEAFRNLATSTLKSWEAVRSGVQRLLCAYPARVCRHCGEVHVGPSGHDARMCGVFKYEPWRGKHSWRKARLGDLVPQRIGWFRRRQDPPVLVDKGRGFYGHAPAVVALCGNAGALVPTKYFTLMKLDGLSAPVD